MIELQEKKDCEISFFSMLCDWVGYYVYGEKWVVVICQVIMEYDMFDCFLYVVSVNLYSVMNLFYVEVVLGKFLVK